ncbi:MAG: signal peptidase I [Clostridia bacterium]|nr:signal peptidase I [Clostridia bacterium]
MEEIEKRNNIKEIIEWILCIVIAVILALVVRHYVFTPTVVRQVSMKPTLIENDRLFLNRLSITTKQEIKRGEIITFEAPSVAEMNSSKYDVNNPVAIYENEPNSIFSKFIYYVLEIGKESYIKRVIGVAGDHILIEDRKSVP